MRWCSERGFSAEAVQERDVLRFLDWYRGRVGQASVVRRFASLRFYYRWLVSERCRADDPTGAIHLKQVRPLPKQPLSEDELRRLLNACRRSQDRALVLLMADAGLRLAEITALRKGDVDFGQGTIRVHGKGDKDRLVAPSERTLAALYGCLDGRDYPWRSQRLDGPMTRDGVYRLFRRLRERTGIHVYPRRLRTTFACRFAESTNGDIDSLKVLMGHSRLETTAHYISYVRLERALRQARAHSLADRIAH